ncbi:MAG TPA: hypothetical protein DHW71_07640 [Gammaproteobacteria bacterium]|nr:hypothetical protein [Gammaproteobacteria bacterium]MEC8011051.1 hypothetical protein [Pseudomonadota bacterium]HBF09683.1 hypothetical protein [Gammaproteobacteria bacterium]HCK92842.1 hypothetical protein [Gammaproteobacteria bacterium]|tara:strand:+ start:1970 stop:2335 length:366 start_codon:yes stop_codon:yes gene_type:complete
MNRVFITFLLLNVLTACNSVAQKNTRQHFQKGIYTCGFEVSEFKACHDQNSAWLTGSDHVLQTLSDKCMMSKSEPYPRYYIEMKSHSLEKAEDGFAQDYDSVIYIDELFVHEPLAHQCDVY